MKILACFIALAVSLFSNVYSQERNYSIKGNVTDIAGEPIAGATVSLINVENRISAVTDLKGDFSLESADSHGHLIVSHIGYNTKSLNFDGEKLLLVVLEHEQQELADVVISTGYYKIPKERATGSFSYVDNDALNLSVNSNIISRLEGVASSFILDNRNLRSPNSNNEFLNRTIRIRGLSTIDADTSPLIVVNNFPFEGDISNINPNDVESVTILKDAAAASIWGAKAANGVIVINTKSGNYNQRPDISLNTNFSIGSKPDLYYSPSFMSSSDFIEFEKIMFDRKAYVENNWTPLSPVTELLIAQSKGLIDGDELTHNLNMLKNNDIRDDASKYLYRNRQTQFYNLNVVGGAERVKYYVSGGYEKDMFNLIGSEKNRMTLNSTNAFKVNNRLEMSLGISLMLDNIKEEGMELANIRPGNKELYPYARLLDDNGIPSPVMNDYRKVYTDKAIENGLYNWDLVPLDNRDFQKQNSRTNELRFDLGVNYKIINGLNLDLKYQHFGTSYQRKSLQLKESYSVRDMVNRYTQANGEKIIPYNDILTLRNSENKGKYGRAQFDFNKSWSLKHNVNALVGAEIRSFETEGTGYGVYGYDSNVNTFLSQIDYTKRYETLPRGTATIPSLSAPLTNTIDRYVSYYSNVSYSLYKKYILSGSIRTDASNLFGVKANQRWVPLWSLGASWIVSDENFYGLNGLPYLKFRITYGYNGNVDKTVAAYPVAYYWTDPYTSLRSAEMRTPGNPELRWEKVGNMNLAIDFGAKDNSFSGSIEYFVKNGKDLMGRTPIDPTTGAFSNQDYYQRMNYASLKTSGIDVDINKTIINKSFKWYTTFTFSYVTDKVTKIDSFQPNITNYVGSFPPPVVGKSLNRINSFPWYGLDPIDGSPRVLIDGEYSQDYSKYLQGLTEEDLEKGGSSIPVLFGSFRNSFRYKNWSFSGNLIWKAGYYFRKPSLSYNQLINNWKGHADFQIRWQVSGDEKYTDVPSLPLKNNTNRDLVYNFSEINMERGDHLRLRTIAASYNFINNKNMIFGLNSLKINFTAENLGILWRANKHNLDPDFPSVSILPVKTFTIGIQAIL